MGFARFALNSNVQLASAVASARYRLKPDESAEATASSMATIVGAATTVSDVITVATTHTAVAGAVR